MKMVVVVDRTRFVLGEREGCATGFDSSENGCFFAVHSIEYISFEYDEELIVVIVIVVIVIIVIVITVLGSTDLLCILDD